jgi:hypothetical protein
MIILIIIWGQDIDMIICKWQQTYIPSIKIKRFVIAIERLQLQLNDFLLTLDDPGHAYLKAAMNTNTYRYLWKAIFNASK